MKTEQWTYAAATAEDAILDLGYDKIASNKILNHIFAHVFADESGGNAMQKGILFETNGQDGKSLVSVKTGNIFLNWRRLSESLPNIAFAGASAATTAWLVPFAALLIAVEISKQLKLEINPTDSAVFAALWAGRDQSGYSHLEAVDICRRVNEYSGLPDEGYVDKKQILASVQRLEKVGCLTVRGDKAYINEVLSIRG